MPDFTQFKSVISIGNSLVSDQIEANVVAFFDWAFLQAGGYFNVSFPAAGTALRCVDDPDYEIGQVWEGYRKDWVWETGVPVGTYPPIGISGVWLAPSGNPIPSGLFWPVGSGWHIDYPQGRIVFDSPLPSGDSVSMEYTFRRVNVDTADSEWFQDLQFNTLNLTNTTLAQFQEQASGAWNVLSRNRIQMPALVIESVQRVRMIPLEIGSSARMHQQDVLFHVLAETPFDRKQLHDLVIAQWQLRMQFFDKNAIEDANAWPLDDRGTPVSGTLTYPELIAPTGQGGFAWRIAWIPEMQSEPQTSLPPLYRAKCRGTFEVDIP